MTPNRLLVYRFMELPHVFKDDIKRSFLGQDEPVLEDTAFFILVRENLWKADLWDAINKASGENEKNPFSI